IAMACFAVFSGIAGYRTWQGADSCGCFGQVVIRPIYTLILDLIFLGAFVLHRPAPEVITSRRWARWTILIIVVSALAWSISLAVFRPELLTPSSPLRDDYSSVIVTASDWPGKRLPLRIEISDSDP